MSRGFHIFLLVLLSVVFLTGCSEVRDFIEFATPDEETVAAITDPDAEKNPDAEVEKYKEYFDEKTGEPVTKTQLVLYKAEDKLKVEGFIVAVVFWIAGFSIRFFVKKSTKIRRIALFFELIPIMYVIIVYLLAFIADAA